MYVWTRSEQFCIDVCKRQQANRGAERRMTLLPVSTLMLMLMLMSMLMALMLSSDDLCLRMDLPTDTYHLELLNWLSPIYTTLISRSMEPHCTLICHPQFQIPYAWGHRKSIGNSISIFDIKEFSIQYLRHVYFRRYKQGDLEILIRV